MFTITVTLDGLERKFDLAIDRASHIEDPMREVGERLLAKAKQRYADQNFEPLKKGTLGGRVSKGLNSMERKLAREATRAGRKQARVTPEPRGLLQQALASVGMKSAGAIINPPSKAFINRIATLAEFQKQQGRQVTQFANGKKLTDTQLKKLAERTERAVASAVNRPILGKLNDSLVLEVDFDTAVVASRTRKKWTDIHNDGGTAGRGAQIPKRATLFLEEDDIEFLKEKLKDHIVEAFEK